VTADPLVLVAELDRATDRLLATTRTLDDLSAPSLCAGWTRGHVLSHVSRNADGHVNLVRWASTGVETPMYPSAQARDEGITAGAFRRLVRPLDEQIADLETSAAALRDAMAAMPASAWTTQIRFMSGPAPAARLVWNRLCEVEIHHVDLAAGYKPADWPESFSARLIHDSSVPPGVIGPTHAVAAWLIGRSDGSDLAGPLPPVPAWK
jgi:maleylpyruvate isomerase